MTPAWAQRQEALRRDCIVSPDVFSPMVDRLGAGVAPSPHALKPAAGPRHVPLSRQGWLAHWPRKNEQLLGNLRRKGCVLIRGSMCCNEFL